MSVLARRRAQAAETRGMAGDWPNGYGYADPAAIPPPGLFNMQRAGVSVTPHTMLQVSAVHRCVEVVVNAVIGLHEPRAYREQLDDIGLPYPVYLPQQPLLLTGPWANQLLSDGTSRTVASLMLFSEAFWHVLARDYLGFPTSLEVLHPGLMTVKPGDNGQPEYWYGTGTARTELPAEDITHIFGLSMPGASRALNNTQYSAPAVAVALAAQEYGARWFSQGAAPSYLLSTDQKLGAEEPRRIAERFMVEHAGLNNAHLPLVVDGGLKVQKIGSTPDESQYLGTLDAARKEIAGYFGIPVHLVGEVGDTGNVWGKGVEEANYALQDFTLSGYVVRLEEAWSSLLPRGQKARYLTEEFLFRANAESRSKLVLANRTAAVTTPNEERRRQALPPLPDGNQLVAPLNSNMAPGQVASTVDAPDNNDSQD